MANECPKCQTNNPDSVKFCGECGTQLPSLEGIDVTETLETAKEELATGSTFAGRYQIIEELGKGGMGRVYKVLDKETKERIALKLIKPEIASDRKTIERFKNELTTARKIRHKNVCGMYYLGEDKGRPYITMEHVSGEDLKSSIRRFGNLPTGKAIAIARQICEGLEEAHSLGIVHRDLKPNNVMIDDHGNTRIMDFGIARSIKGKSITGSGVMIGTPEYMSPEQVEGKEVDERSDLYSLGVILYEIVTGRLPFEGETPLSIAHKHRYEPPPDPRKLNPQVPEDLSRLILRCLEKDKANRYQTAGELRSGLEKIGERLPTTERFTAQRKPLTSREITVKFSLKKLALPGLAVFVLVAAAVLLLIFFPHKKSPGAPVIENSIAVISFKNQTGDPAYDHLQEAIPNLLITNLENTGLFYVATWERMKDILKQMGVKQAEFIDSENGFALCRREGIKAIAIGSFSMAGDVFTTDVKVYDAETKRNLKSANDRGNGVDSIFGSQIDNLSREISLGLGAGLDTVEAARINIKGITTHSLEAYKYFLKGTEACNLHSWKTARENLEKALELDPAFAMAYVYLAWTYIDTGPDEAINEAIEKAMSVSDKTSQKDRLYLDALYAYFVEHETVKSVKILDELILKYPDEKWALHVQGDFLRKDDNLDRAYDRYRRWLELDPQDPNALYHISNVSAMMGDLEKAEGYIKKHEEVAPPEAENLGLQALIYERIGQLDKAIAKSKEILEIRPDYLGNLNSIAILYSLKEEYEESLKWANEYVSLASSPGQKRSSFERRGEIHFLRGAFAAALADLTQVVQMVEEADSLDIKGYALESIGLVYLVRGDYEACRKFFENMPIDNSVKRREFTWGYKADRAFDLGMLALKQGQTGPAKARLSEIESLQPEIRGDKIYIHFIRDLLEGEAQLAQGALDEALAAGKMACGPESPIWSLGINIYGPPVYYMDLLARIYAKKGDVGQAISEYERLLKENYSTGFSFTIYPLYHYRLGHLYEKANEPAKAAAQYERFLSLWKNADPGLPEVDDAKKRLAGLKD